MQLQVCKKEPEKLRKATQFIQLLKLCEDNPTNFCSASHNAKAHFLKTLKKNEFITHGYKTSATEEKLKGENSSATKKGS